MAMRCSKPYTPQHLKTFNAPQTPSRTGFFTYGQTVIDVKKK